MRMANDSKKDASTASTTGGTTTRTGSTSKQYDSTTGKTDTSPKGRAEVSGSRSATTRRSGVRTVEATRTREEDRNVAMGGYVEVKVPAAYSTLEAEQPDGTRKEYKTGELATMPMRQAKTLGILDEEGNLREGDIRANDNTSYGQKNEPVEVSREDEGEGSPESGSDATAEEVGRAPR